MRRDPEDALTFALVIVVAVMMFWLGTLGAGARPGAKAMPITPDQTIQIKLRDLLPAKVDPRVGEILAKVTAIDQKVTAIDQKLGGAVPLPPVTPAPPGAFGRPK